MYVINWTSVHSYLLSFMAYVNRKDVKNVQNFHQVCFRVFLIIALKM